MQEALVKIELTARHTAFHKVKQRARFYRKHRFEMALLDTRLFHAYPRQAVAIGEALLDAASQRSSRVVQLAPVSLMNARAVLVLARFERRYAREMEAVA